jgi:hypothetical protein
MSSKGLILFTDIQKEVICVNTGLSEDLVKKLKEVKENTRKKYLSF